MQFIFTADTHFSSAFGAENSQIRNGELIACFKEIINYAKENSIKLIVLGGDLFDTPYPLPEIKAAVKNIIQSNSDIQFIGICGNHDPIYKTDFYSSLPSNFYLFPEKITEFRFQDITFYGVSEQSFDQNTDKWKDFHADGKFITLSHGDLQPAIFADTGASLCLFGHIHKTQTHVLSNGVKALYCGCPAGRGFDECEQKGFYVVDSESLSFEFIKTSAKIYKEYELDISDTENINELISVLEGIEVCQSEIARAVLTGKVKKPYTIDCERLCGLMPQFTEIKDKTEVDVDILENINKNTLEGEFVRILIAKHEAEKDETEKQKILDAIKKGIIALRRK